MSEPRFCWISTERSGVNSSGVPSMWLLKLRAVVADLHLRRQTENLEATRVREDRPIPVHKGVEAAEVANEFITGPQRKVIGVAQDNPRTSIADHLRGEPLHRSLRSNGHERGSLDQAVRSLEEPGAGLLVSGDERECDGHFRDRKSEIRDRKAKKREVRNRPFRSSDL